MKLRKLINNRFVLYVVYLFALCNILGYFMNQDMDSVIFFSALGYLSSYFSKNMIVNLLATIIATKIFSFKREGQQNMKKKKKTVDDDDEEDKDTMTINAEDNIKAGYDNLQSILGSEGIKNLRTDSAELATQQQQILENMKTMQPMLKQISGMMNQFGGIDGITNMVKSLDQFKNKNQKK